MSLAGKVALITGGAQGIGQAVCEALLKNGAKVCLTDLNEVQGEKTTAEFNETYGVGKVEFVKCDVTSQEDMEHAFSRCAASHGKLDIVCNNAGIGHETKWNLTVDINLKGTIRGTLLGVEYLRKDKGGNGGIIINVASSAGLVPVPFAPVYCATKHAVVGLTRSWACNLDREAMGIRFCTMCPSFVDTPLLHVDVEDDGRMYYPEKAVEYTKKIGVMSPEFVAEGFIQLVEDEKSNGTVMKLTKCEGIRIIDF